MFLITPEALSKIFGYKSTITKKFIFELYRIIQNNDDKVKSKFERWYALFQVVGGYRKDKYKSDTSEISKLYSLPTPHEYSKILFAIHTYYSIIVRWLTYKILFKDQNIKYSNDTINPEVIQKHCHESGINNFGLTDYFDWYFDLASERLFECFDELEKQFMQCDIKVDLKDEYEDLFKPLYQNIFPSKIRHNLGEYYTPSWLAELTIKNSGFDFNPDKKVLDPACGSGTFIIEVLKNILSKAHSNNIIPEVILKNIVGFDLNPLAVLSTKANYILALRKFLPFKCTSNIPIFHFDSIVCSNDITLGTNKISLFEKLQQNTLPLMFDKIPERYIENPEFDFIFGNPPWINWKFLPEYYRNSVLPAAEKYNLFNHKGLKARLGFAQDDLSVILTYVAIDRFLKDSGILSFVLPQTLFKTVGGGEGFRQFRLGREGKTFKVKTVLDLSGFKVFDSSAGKSAIFTCQKGYVTKYPIHYEIWAKKNNENIESSASLDMVLKKIKKINHLAEPVNDFQSSWITADKEILRMIKNIIRPSYYKARAGVCTWASSIYWVKKISESNKLIDIINYNETAKYKQNETFAQLESDLIYPLVRGRNIIRWHFDSDVSIILPQSKDNLSKAMNEITSKAKYNNVYNYFMSFKKFLLNRKGYNKFLSNEPFYAVYDIGPYTFSKFKVAWKYLDNDLRAVMLVGDKQNKTFIPDLNVITVSVDSVEEAHYLAAFLNSSLIRLIIQTFGLCTRITPGVLKYLPIEKFDPKNKNHLELVNCSIECHKHFLDDRILHKFSSRIDLIVKEILRITDNQFTKVQKNLDFYLNEK
jgi:methylase of polypeptide subunit release factors